jgi:hypothetical protein
MRLASIIPLSVAAGATLLLPARHLFGPSSPAGATQRCESGACAATVPAERATERPLPAGDVPAFLMASVQPIKAPEAWRAIYHQVERCAGKVGNYDEIRWAVMDAPLQGPKGPTYGFNVGSRIVLVRSDTTYLRHEMLHHILQTAGWQPPSLRPGEHYTVADLHPMPLFGLCTGGR